MFKTARAQTMMSFVEVRVTILNIDSPKFIYLPFQLGSIFSMKINPIQSYKPIKFIYFYFKS